MLSFFHLELVTVFSCPDSSGLISRASFLGPISFVRGRVRVEG